MSAALDKLERRVRQIRQCALVRAWEYRQRNHAHGVWYRLRRVLVDAAEVYVISEEEMALLLAKGRTPEPVGAQLEPQKVMLFVSLERAATVPGRRQIPVRPGPELLGGRHLMLVPFQG